MDPFLLLLAAAALALAALALGVAWSLARRVDEVSRRLDAVLLAARPAPATPVAPPHDATPAVPGELEAVLERGDDGRPVLLLRNGGAPASDLVVALDGWFVGNAGGPYEDAGPPPRLAAGATWRCPVLTDPDPSGRLHVLLRWVRGGAVERRELELAR